MANENIITAQNWGQSDSSQVTFDFEDTKPSKKKKARKKFKKLFVKVKKVFKEIIIPILKLIPAFLTSMADLKKAYA